MATVQQTASTQPAAVISQHEYPPAPRWFERGMMFTSIWILVGAYVDGWGHNFRLNTYETFFTPWHWLLYSGLLATAALTGYVYAKNLRAGYRWGRLLPKGYTMTMIGVIVFSIGGAMDGAWHTLFGFEGDAEALLSPPHHFLVAGTIMGVSGPFLAAWGRGLPSTRWRDIAPAVVSLTMMLGLLGFIMQGMHPFAEVRLIWVPSSSEHLYDMQLAAASSVMLQSAIIVGAWLLLIRRWGAGLPFGTLTVLLTVTHLLAASQANNWVLPLIPLLTGLVGDGLYRWLKPTPESRTKIWFLGTFIPVLLYTVYVVALSLFAQIFWEVHGVAGLVTAAAAAGFMVAFAMFPPRVPEASM